MNYTCEKLRRFVRTPVLYLDGAVNSNSSSQDYAILCYRCVYMLTPFVLAYVPHRNVLSYSQMSCLRASLRTSEVCALTLMYVSSQGMVHRHEIPWEMSQMV